MKSFLPAFALVGGLRVITTPCLVVAGKDLWSFGLANDAAKATEADGLAVMAGAGERDLVLA